MVYERSNIQRLSPYESGEQPDTPAVIKLNTNENPYPPVKAVLHAIAKVEAEALRRYPPPLADEFRQTAAEFHGLTPKQVIATNGGDELLRLLITVFCDPCGESPSAGGLGWAEPSYSLYPVLARIHDTSKITIALNDDFSLPHDFADQLNDAGARLAFIVNPHAPSGYLESLAHLEQVACRFKGVLVIDEAYVNFSPCDAMPLLDPAKGLENVILLRSLSKGYSLAGLRFGYGLGPAPLIAALDKARDSYNTNVLAQHAAIAALEHVQDAAKSWQAVIEQRDRMNTALATRGWYIYPSQANFILGTPADQAGSAKRAKLIYETLKQNGILVRYFDQDRLRDKLRITVGTADQNHAMLATLDEINHG